jgi:4-amino-4-deoxy-L-arabinose transferase-like glycosyltransferase
MAVARNFYDEGMNILQPRVDKRADTNGITGMQFPSYEWLVAGSYHVFGFHEALPRIITWLIYVAGVIAFYQLVNQISGSVWLSGIGAWCLTWSPELYYHGINALPDVLAFTASTAGLFWFGRWRASKHLGYLGLSLLGVTLGGLTKLQFLVVGFPIAVWVIRDVLQRRYTVRDGVLLTLYAAVSVGLSLSWYAYALHLIQTSGLTNFGLEFRPAADWATGLHILKRNLLSDWPELLLGYGALGLLLVGLGRLVRHAPVRHPWFLPGVVWAVALGAYYLIELRQMEGHTYYMLPLLPVLLLLATWGAAWLLRTPKARNWLVILLLVQPIWAFARVNYGRWLTRDPDVAPELFNPVTRAQLEAATPANALCLVGPDNSSCIDFYFLHKKGFAIEWAGQLVQPTAKGQLYIAECIARGARYLYTNDSTSLQDARVQPYLEQKLTQVGHFTVWKLRAQPEAQRR